MILCRALWGSSAQGLCIVSNKLNVSRQRVQKEITKVTIKLVLVALQVLKAPTDFPPCPSPGSPPVLPRRALLLHSPPDPPGPLHYPRSPAQASAQASLPHGCWRARGSSAEEARSGSKGTQVVSRHTAELLCVLQSIGASASTSGLPMNIQD